MNRQSRGYRAAVAVEHKVLGAAFLALLVLAGWFTHAVFTKRFTDYEPVELLTSRVGLQLGDRADVKLRGVVVGEVIGIRSAGDGASLTLGLYPSQIDTVPADVTARILPKTLFGEKYVALEIPEGSTSGPIRAGDRIDQTQVAIEVERVLNDFYPLLRAVQPAELNYTLTAVASAMEGRGAELGQNLATLNRYLERTNPQIPAAIADLRMLGEVSEVYRSVLPELARLLRNSVRTGATLIEKEQKIQALFADVAGFSSTSRDFLEANGDNIIRLNELGRQSLPVFARYAPEYPCLLQGIVNVAPKQAEAFRGYTLHINLEPLPRQPRGYGPQDQAVYGDRRGPSCNHLPDPPWTQDKLPPDSLVPDIVDGVDEPTGKDEPSRTEGPARVAPVTGAAGDPAVDLTSGYAGTAAERTLVNALAAPGLGVTVDQVPDVASLLFGPLARGNEVEVR